MREAQTPDHVSLSTLLGYLKEGRYVVPDFQREFEWEARDIRELARSIFRDYYIGSLLLWKTSGENFKNLSCEPIYGQAAGKPDYIVLDGQQRLTAINYAFVAPDVALPRRKSRALYFMRLDRFANDEDDAFDYAWVWSPVDAGIAGANAVFGNAEQQYRDHLFPLAVVGAGGLAPFEWAHGYKTYWEKRAEALEGAEQALASEYAEYAKEFSAHLISIIGNFQISYIELHRDLEIEKVCDIFTQINSRGVRLDVFDLMNALLKPKNVQLKALWRAAAPKLDFIESAKLNVYILQVMSILRQTYCSPKYLYYLLPGVERKMKNAEGVFERQLMVETPEDFVDRWDKAVAALQGAITQLKHPHEFGVSKSSYLPYSSILPIFAAALSVVKELPAGERLAAQGKFRLWYWASIFTNQYSASSETTAARDILALRTWFADDASEPAIIAQFKRDVATLDLRAQTKKGDAIYNAIFNLLVIAGARDWCTGAIPAPDELDDHHIVPKSWGTKNLTGNAVDTILNRTPLTGETNRIVIHDRLPNQYLPEMIATNGREKIEAMMESHFISPAAIDILCRTPFTPDDFEAFVRERQRSITRAVQTLLVGGRADLSPDLRALDEDVERIELALRSLVARRLNDDPAQLPDHIRVKIDQRITGAMKKSAGDAGERYTSLSGALEFADLMELRGIMEATATAPLFVDVFPHKPTLIGKYEQLAELRNSIRHSRTVSEVARKEGEAAILWFSSAMGSSV